jgi:hypothetical protein
MSGCGGSPHAREIAFDWTTAAAVESAAAAAATTVGPVSAAAVIGARAASRLRKSDRLVVFVVSVSVIDVSHLL